MSKRHMLEVIIETPKGSRNKYIYNEKEKHVKLKKCMPLGFLFPFDFGMIPGTKAEDGDPLDILILMEEPVYPGVFVEARIIGAMKADQTKKDTVRNDRVLAVSTSCPVYGSYESLEDVADDLKKQIEEFFVSYNDVTGKTFEPLGWVDAEKALGLIKKADK